VHLAGVLAPFALTVGERFPAVWALADAGWLVVVGCRLRLRYGPVEVGAEQRLVVERLPFAGRSQLVAGGLDGVGRALHACGLADGLAGAARATVRRHRIVAEELLLFS
jgi:hypothetical protein